MSKNPHIGSDFVDFLAEQGVLEEASAIAVKRVIAWQIKQAMQATDTSKTAFAQRMHTNRTVVDRMLDAGDTGLTLETIVKAAAALGFRVKMDLVTV